MNKNHLGGWVHGGDQATWDPDLWNHIMDIYSIKSIIDVGCGEGHSLKYFKDAGLKCVGIEGDIEAINNSKIKDLIVEHDYTLGKPNIDQKFDAIWCCEFIEHVEEKYIDNFVDTFLKAKHIFITHALPGQGGHHHVNEKTIEYWRDKFETYGIIYDEGESKKLRLKAKAYFTKRGICYFNNKNIT